MSEEILAGASGLFALAGVGMANALAAARETRAFRRDLAVALVDVERLVWSEQWLDLEVELQRIAARMAIAGVPADLREAFHSTTVTAFRSYQRSLERSAGQEASISSTVAGARRDLQEVIGRYLLSGRFARRRLHARRREVFDQARAARADYNRRRSS